MFGVLSPLGRPVDSVNPEKERYRKQALRTIEGLTFTLRTDKI